MSNIKLIARETLRQLTEHKIEPTPEAYEKEFYHQMKKMGIKREDSPITVNRLLAMLRGEAKEISNKTFKNKDELTIFLIKMLNLTYHYRKIFNTQLEMEKIFLELLSTHPSKEINMLAKGELMEIDKINLQTKEMYKRRWMEQSQKKIENVWNDFDRALGLLSDFEIENDQFKVLQELVKKYLGGNRSEDVGKYLLKKIETFFQELSLSASQQEEEDLESEQDLEAQKTDTLKYAYMDSLPFNSMTTLISREGMQDILSFAEEEYKANKKNYSLIVFGIVGYNQIAQSYGKEALKKVLATLGKILKQHSNASDLIGYYGEDEFLACLLDREKEEAIAFIRQLDVEVKKNVFVYQQTHIPIKLSAQVSHRINEESLESMLKRTFKEFAKYKGTQGVIDEA